MRCNCLMHTKFAARLTPFAGLIFAFSALSAAEYGYVGTETTIRSTTPNRGAPQQAR